MTGREGPVFTSSRCVLRDSATYVVYVCDIYDGKPSGWWESEPRGF